MVTVFINNIIIIINSLIHIIYVQRSFRTVSTKLHLKQMNNEFNSDKKHLYTQTTLQWYALSSSFHW